MSLYASNSEIQELEENLLEAMILGNISFLENIFSERYVFLGSGGSSWGKEKALEDFRNPEFILKNMKICNRRITMHNNCAIVTGTSVVEGKIGENTLTGRYQFMRVWDRGTDGWQIIAVSTSKVEEER